jgi:hypothetical protein
MRIRLATVLLLLVTGAAYAEDDIPLLGPVMRPEDMPQAKQREQSYRDGLSKIPEQKGSHDPWGIVRPAKSEKDKKNN